MSSRASPSPSPSPSPSASASALGGALPPRWRRQQGGAEPQAERRSVQARHARQTRTSMHADESERRRRGSAEGKPTREGGWSSVNNRAGQPYQPLGEPTLDFVFPVKRRSYTHPFAPAQTSTGTHVQHASSPHAQQQGRMHAAWQQQQQQQQQQHQLGEEKEKESGEAVGMRTGDPSAPAASATATSSNSLDLHDPVRDLLAICTPRRADALESSLAIKERVILSAARVNAVKAGARFEQIDRAGRGKMQTEQFRRDTANAYAAAAGATTPRSGSETAPPAVSFPHHPSLSDDEVGSSLIRAHFALLADWLASGSLGLHSDPAELLQQSRTMGGPFPLNFNSNAFRNLAAHPLLEREVVEKGKHQLLDGRATPVGLIPGAGVRPLSVSVQSPTPSECPSPTRAAAAASVAPSAPTFLTLPPCPPAAAAAPSQPATARSTSTRAVVTARGTQRFPVPGGAREGQLHAHAPPPILSFHALRYTLHQSFGTQVQQPDRDQATQMGRKGAAAKRQQREHEGSASARSAAPASLPTPPSPPSGSSSARADVGRGRGRSRAARVHASAHAPDPHAHSSATSPRTAGSSSSGAAASTSHEVEYSRAVQASKYRREHNNSPTSHWERLQENVGQRYHQLRALSNMAYFNPEGNLFQQPEGGALRAEEARKARRAARMRQRELQKQAQQESAAVGGSGVVGLDGASSLRARPPADDGSGAAATTSRPQPIQPRSIHDGQILRQVANTSWDDGSGARSARLKGAWRGDGEEKESHEGGGGGAGSPFGSDIDSAEEDAAHFSSLTSRAELTLARCYADFDLAKRDLKERLYESLALQDSERGNTVWSKCASFTPEFLDAESDILRMRLPGEKARLRVLRERLDNFEVLHGLVRFINVLNGGGGGGGGGGPGGKGGVGDVDGAPDDIDAVEEPLDVDLSQATDGQVQLRASLPSFEEIYLVEVLTTLVDSGVPMCADHRANARVIREVEKRSREAEKNGPSRAVASATAANHATSGGSTSSYTYSHSLSPSSSSSSLHPSASSSSAPTCPPPPSLLLLLLSLDPRVFRSKKVRSILAHWAKLCGVGEEALDAGMRMLGVHLSSGVGDPRESKYSARGMKGMQGTGADTGLPVGGDGEMGGGASTSTAADGRMIRGMLDASTKAALMRSTALGVLPSGGRGAGSSAPVSRPLSSVLLAPVSLGEWESRRASQHVREEAREVMRRARTARQLTTSSHARTTAHTQQRQTQHSHAAFAPPLATHAGAGTSSAPVPPPLAAPRPPSPVPEARGLPSKHRTGVSQSLVGMSLEAREARMHMRRAEEAQLSPSSHMED